MDIVTAVRLLVLREYFGSLSAQQIPPTTTRHTSQQLHTLLASWSLMASFGEKLKAFGQKITGQEPEPETLPQQLLRQVDEATTLTWKQVSGS